MSSVCPSMTEHPAGAAPATAEGRLESQRIHWPAITGYGLPPHAPGVAVNGVADATSAVPRIVADVTMNGPSAMASVVADQICVAPAGFVAVTRTRR